MKEFWCSIAGHNWFHGKWWKVSGDASWHRYHFCKRCSEHYFESVQTEPAPLDTY